MLGPTEAAQTHLSETRGGRIVQHQLVPLLRQSAYSLPAGYEDTNDAVRLAKDPAMRVIVGWRGTDKQPASTNTMSRLSVARGLGTGAQYSARSTVSYSGTKRRISPPSPTAHITGPSGVSSTLTS